MSGYERRNKKSFQAVLKSLYSVDGSEVTQGHQNRHVSIRANDFLLTFHSNQGPISHCFRHKRRFQSKIAKFTHPEDFSPPLNGFRHWG